MIFPDGRSWSGSAASRAANRVQRKGRRSFNGISSRRRAAVLMILRVRGRIKKRTGGCWGWSKTRGYDRKFTGYSRDETAAAAGGGGRRTGGGHRGGASTGRTDGRSCFTGCGAFV